MDKLRSLPIALVCLFVLKVLLRGSELSDSLIILGLIALSAFTDHRKKDSQYQELKEEIKSLKADLTSRNQSVDAMSTKVAAMQVSSGMKTLRNG